jgi:hypothetical protein
LNEFLSGADKINDLLDNSLAETRRHGINAAPNAPVNFGANRPALASVSEAFKHNGITNAIELGRKLVNGIVITRIGKTGLQLSVPTVDVSDMLQGFVGCTAGEPMLRSFLTVVWGLYEAVCTEREQLVQVVFAHKSEERLIEGLRWWSRCCNSDREASILEASEASHRKKRRCYAYLGGGQLSDGSSQLLQNIVVKTKTRHMGACVMAACTLLSRASEDGHIVRARHELFLAAADVAEDDDKLIEMEASDDDGDDEPGRPAATGAPVQWKTVQYKTPGLEFAA